MKSARSVKMGFIALLFLFLVSPLPAAADAIILKNGNRIEAQKVWEEDGDVKCNQYGGVVGFPKEEVLCIEQQQGDKKPDGSQNRALSAWNEKAVLSEVRQLYVELMGFKDDPLFHKVGFAPENKYAHWMDKVGRLYEDSRAKGLLAREGIPVEDLLNLGLEYFKSGGKETTFSRFANAEFRKALNR
jgi:hypothetical protein